MSGGFDEMFDEGLFRTGRHNSTVARPPQWPQSVSEMSRYTTYTESSAPGGYGESMFALDDYSDGIFAAGRHNTQLTRPEKWPSSVSEMRKHTSYANQGMSMAAGYDTAHQTYAEKRLAPRGRWVYLPAREGWVWVA